MGLPVSRRLRRHGEFARVKEAGVSQKGRFLVLNAFQTGAGAPARCGIITSRKTGNAVGRNRIRRRIREIIRLEDDRIIRGFWLVVIARWNAAGASMEDLKQDWARCARRAGIIQDRAA